MAGDAILEKGTKFQLTKNRFSRLDGVSVMSITLWEAKGKCMIMPHTDSLKPGDSGLPLYSKEVD